MIGFAIFLFVGLGIGYVLIESKAEENEIAALLQTWFDDYNEEGVGTSYLSESFEHFENGDPRQDQAVPHKYL